MMFRQVSSHNTFFKISAVLVFLFGFLAGPVFAERFVETPSGRAEGVFPDSAMDKTMSQLASKCMDFGMPVEQRVGAVRCERVMSTGEQVLLGALTAPRNASGLKQIVEFSMAQIGKDTRVQTRWWQEYTTAFGQYNQIPLNGDEYYVQGLLLIQAAGGKLPIGSTFRRLPYLGLEWRDGSRAFQGKTYKGVRVTSVAPEAPASLGGLREGDIIVGVEGVKAATISKISKLVDFVPLGSLFTIQILRSDGFYDVKVRAQKRHDITSYGPEERYYGPDEPAPPLPPID